MDTVVVTLETASGHENLAFSLDMLGIPWKRIGYGATFDTMMDKARLYKEALEEMDNEWVILSDSRDVLFYRNIKVINEIYQNYYSEYDIIVQAEAGAHGDVDARRHNVKRHHEFFKTDDFCKYPCAGLMMGKRLAIIALLNSILNETPKEWQVSDQTALEWCMVNLKHNIGLDRKCRIFQEMAMGHECGVNFFLHFNPNWIFNRDTGTFPCVFHGAGRSILHQVWKIIRGRYGSRTVRWEPARIYIDLGAHNGVTIQPYLNDDSITRIYAFEANPTKYSKLEQKFANEILRGRLVLENKIVWTSDGKVDFNLNKDTQASSIYHHSYGEEIEAIPVESLGFSEWLAKTVTADDYIIVKMDIEGAEFEILDQMIETNTIKLVNELYVEFHNRFFNPRIPVQRNNSLRRTIQERGVKIMPWH